MLDFVVSAKGGARSEATVEATKPSFDVRVWLHRDLAALADRWRSLERTGRATAFQRFDWIELVAERLAANATVLVAEVTDRGGRPLMLLPLVAQQRFGVRTIGCLDLDVCDYAAPAIARGFAPTRDVMEAVWAAIRRGLPRADLLRLSRMPVQVGGGANPLLLLPGARPMSMHRYGLPISPPPDDLVRRVTRSSTFRDLAKFERRLERRGAVAFTPASTADEIDATLSALNAQRAARFAEMGRFNLLDRADIRDFYRAAALDGLTGGPVRVFGLSVDGECVATAYGLVNGDEFCLLIQTMAGGEWRNCSPGVLVSARAMQWATAEGLTYFDFSIGHLPYKLDLGGSEGELFELVQILSPVGAAAAGWARLADGAKTALRRHPATFERLRTLRRQLRRVRA